MIALILDPRTIRAMLGALGGPPEGTDRAPPADSTLAAADAVPA